MKKKFKESEERIEHNFQVFDDNELSRFNEDLQRFRVDKVLTSGERVSYIKYEDWLIEEKATNKDGAVIVEPRENGYQWPSRYIICMDKIRQWYCWQERKSYGEQKRLEHLDELAKGMQIA